jgi:FkbM family methyltransferase
MQAPGHTTMTSSEQPASDASATLGHPGQRHRARSLDALPGVKDAAVLLEELAAGECLFGPVAADRPLALYGAGNLGRLARDFLTTVGNDFAFVIDRNAAERTRERAWEGVTLLRPEDVPEDRKAGVRLVVSVATSPYVPLEDALIAQGFADVAPFYDLAESFRAVHPLSNGWFAPPMTAEDVANTGKVLAGWGDDMSRAHHLQFLAWRRMREEWVFQGAPVTNDDRFFIPEVANLLADDEVFIDAGAHFGGVSETFLARTGRAFGRIVAIEPDAGNRERLEAEFSRFLPDRSQVAILDCALGEAEGEATFRDGLGYASQISPTGAGQIRVRPLDALGLAPSFIKLHLEGAELAALKGARQTLLAHRPIVAATVYHNADGVWKTPLWLMQTLPDYRFLFRAHSWCGTGAVVYALPDERRPR